MKFVLSIVVTLAFCVGAAVAQAGGPAGTQGSSPSMQQPGGQQPGTAQQPQGYPSTGPTTDQSSNTNSTSEKKLKGCVQSQGGQYTLETKKGKEVALTGQDVSAHVGHEVEVKGTWGSASATGMSPSSTGNTAGSEKAFNVTDVKMISESCGGKHKGSSGSMGTAPGGTNPNGTGSSPSGTGPSSTTPPQ